MSKKWVVASMGLMLPLLIILAGCGINRPEYHFRGKINDEQIRAYGYNLFRGLILEVQMANGVIIKYMDYTGDLEIDELYIIKDGEITRYRNSWSKFNPAVQEVMEEAQKQFVEYLKKIHEINSAPLYNNK